MSEDLDISPELGDFVTILSQRYTTTTGRIIYRDDTLLRIRPVSSQNLSVNFPFNQEGEFAEDLGVTELILHEKRKDPHFSKQLNVQPGENLELFDGTGRLLGTVTVGEIIATEEYDAIKLEGGQILNFRFIGPKHPLAVLNPRVLEEPVEESEQPPVEEISHPVFDLNLVPVPEQAEDEFTFTDSIQREDMFVSFLSDVPPKRQKDPKIMARLYRETDLYLAMKNSLLRRDEQGAIVHNAPSQSYIANTVQDAMNLTQQPLAAVLPVMAVQKVLYADVFSEEVTFRDAVVSNDIQSVFNYVQIQSDFTNARGETSFPDYIHRVLQSTRAYTRSTEGASVEYDQDALRSQLPPNPVDGYPSGLPSAIPSSRNDPFLSVENVDSIQDRSVRVIGPSRLKGTNNVMYTVAPGDSAETVGNILVSEEIASYRTPIRSSVLLWDIVASERGRKRKTFLYDLLTNTWDEQRVLSTDESLSAVLESRLPPSLSFMNHATTSILDSVGLRTLERSSDVMTVLQQRLQEGQSTWDKAFAKLSVPNEHPVGPVFSNVAVEGSALLSETTRANPHFQDFLLFWKSKESLLADSDVAIANDYLTTASATLGPLWYAVAGELADEIPKRAKTYDLEKNRIQHSIAVRRQHIQAFTAQPTINTCKHVRELDKIYSIRDDASRMVLFQKFLQTYQGSQLGNFLQCSLCKKDLCCKHEVLLLQEFLNSGRGVALHKALLLEFSGPVFEGNYICRICGQKIREIEYDTHLEFDDEGHPLVGRTVIEDEPENSVPLPGEVDTGISVDDRKYFHTLRMLFEHCGMVVDTESHSAIYKRCIKTIQEYFRTKVAPQSVYEAQIAKAKQKADIPDYSQYVANTLIGILGALAILELQISVIQVPISTPGCVFSRDGFPLTGLDIQTAGTGAFQYIVCSISKIISGQEPWVKSSWSAITSDKIRQDSVKKNIVAAISHILQIPIGGKIPNPLESMSNVYLEALRGTKHVEEYVASQFDKLPLSFRPLPSAISATTETPIANVQQFQKNVESGPLATVLPFVKTRQEQINRTIMAQFHATSKSSEPPLPNNPYSDSVCCFTRLSNLAKTGFGYTSLEMGDAFQKEVLLNTAATKRVDQRNPGLSHSGTHIYVPWSAPFTEQIEEGNVDTTILYKVFLKNCFRGPNVGLVHEFDSDYVCRQCDFAYPKEFVYLTAAEISETNASKHTKAMEALMEERTRLALQSLQGVPMDIEAFRALEQAIRKGKTIPPAVSTPPKPFTVVMEELGATLQSLPADVVAGWSALQTAVQTIQSEHVTSVLSRKQTLRFFSESYDRLKAQVESRMKAIYMENGKREPVAKELVQATMDVFQIASNNPQNFRNALVVGGESVATQYLNNRPNVHKWFKKISYNHALLLNRIWEKTTAVVQTTQKALDVLREDEQKEVCDTLSAMSKQLGAWFSIWFQYVRVDDVLNVEEYTYITQYVVLAHIRSLLSAESRVAELLNTWILNSLNYTSEIVHTYQRTPDEIAAAIAAREELEQAMFIKKFDDLESSDRKVELLKKSLGLGDWAVGVSKNLFKYDPSFYEFQREQRAAMGLPEFTSEITGVAEQGLREVPKEEGYDMRGNEDEDV